MKPFGFHWFLVALVVALALPRPAAAQTVIHDTLGGPASYDSGGYQIDPAIPYAAKFTSGSTSQRLQTVEVPLGVFSTGSNSVSVELWSNVSGAPGALVENLGNTTVSSPSRLHTKTSPSNFLLSPNTQYWIVLTNLGGSGDPFWSYNSSVSTGFASTFGTSSWINISGQATPQMRITALDDIPVGDAVPEPGAVALFLPALGALALAHRRRTRSA